MNQLHPHEHMDAKLSDIIPALDETGGYPLHFVQSLQQVLNDRDKELEAALLLISINNLPMMISGFGHKAAEEAIRAMLLNLKDFLGSDNSRHIITRVQKDQVAIILYHYQRDILNHLLDDLSRHIKAFGHTCEYGVIHILASIASISLPIHPVAAEDIINHAYIALTSKQEILAKTYDQQDNAERDHSRQEMNMVNYITSAIKEGQLLMAFQPVVSSTTGAVAYYEALLRIKKENGELTTAGPLIPVAERMGLIDIIDEIVLEKIVEELQQSPELRLSFNVSNLTANSTAWLKRFKQIADKAPDIPERMIIEITETAVHLDLRRTAYFVAEIQAAGAKVALDDFGSGYTSFRQLKSLSVDVIKIDGVFIRDLVDNHDNHLFIKTMLDFTNGFGLETVAEFVENGETAKILMQLGVQYMQGYYFGYPEVKKLWNT